MKKIFLPLILLFVFVAYSDAQVVLGVRAAGAYSSMIQKVEGVAESGAHFGYGAAGIMEIPLRKRLLLRPEIIFLNQGGRFHALRGNDSHVLYPFECDYYSLQIPANVQFVFTTPEIMFSVFGGPYLDMSLWGRIKEDGASRPISFGGHAHNDLKRFDLGINLGLGVEYNKFFFSVQAFCGTLNRNAGHKDGVSSVYQNNVAFSLGYMFR